MNGAAAVCPEGLAAATGTLPSPAGGTRPNPLCASGDQIVYPVPLFVHNTFIEANLGRPVSLDGFFEERQVTSCPVSCVSETDSLCEGVTVPLMSTRRVPYRPGETLTKSAGFGSTAPLAMFPLASVAQSRKASLAGILNQGSQPEYGRADAFVHAPASPVLQAAESPLVSSASPWAMVPGLREASSRAAAVLRLEEAISGGSTPVIASLDLPSVGSARHNVGQCKPCAFVHTKGCASGSECKFCHLCGKGEKQRRQKEKRAFFGAMRQIQKLAGESWPFHVAAANPARQDA